MSSFLRGLFENYVQVRDSIEMPTLIQIGARQANQFLPFRFAGNDPILLHQIGLSMALVLHREINGVLPHDALRAIVYSLSGTYGIGLRRGAGRVFTLLDSIQQRNGLVHLRQMDMFKSAERFLDTATGDLFPSPRRLTAMTLQANQR